MIIGGDRGAGWGRAREGPLSDGLIRQGHKTNLTVPRRFQLGHDIWQVGCVATVTETGPNPGDGPTSMLIPAGPLRLQEGQPYRAGCECQWL